MKPPRFHTPHRHRLADLGEFSAIDIVSRAQGAACLPWTRGIGDDAAVLGAQASRGALLVTVDALIEDRHFRRAWSTPGELAWKALACNVSDIAAMGGTPLGAVLALGAPGDLEVSWLRAFSRGFAQAAGAFGCPLVGGDTVASDRLVLSVTVLGQASARGAVLRSGAQPGDILCVTGRLGESALGLHLLRTLPEGVEATSVRRAQLARRYGPGTRAALRRHLRGQAQTAAGPLLAARGAHALVDISDGLASEAWHIAGASGVRLVLDEPAVPLAPAVRRLASRLGLAPLDLGLGGGEDYELLVALPPRRVRAAIDALRREAGVSLHVIGHVERAAAPAVELRAADGSCTPLRARGFDHYRPETP